MNRLGCISIIAKSSRTALDLASSLRISIKDFLDIKLLNGLFVHLVKGEALQLERGAQLASGDADIHWQDGPALDPGCVGHGVSVGAIDAFLDGGHHLQSKTRLGLTYCMVDGKLERCLALSLMYPE